MILKHTPAIYIFVFRYFLSLWLVPMLWASCSYIVIHIPNLTIMLNFFNVIISQEKETQDFYNNIEI